jgi:putative chitinase
MSIILPNNNSEIIVNDFINYATIHLTTISGVANTISLYPPVGTPAPGIVTWTGYIIPPAAPPQPTTQVVPNIDEIKLDDSQLTVSIEATLEGNNINEASYKALITPPSNQPSVVKLNEAKIKLIESVLEIPTPPINEEDIPKDNIQEDTGYISKLKVPDDLVLAMKKYKIGVTPLERAHFLSQCDHESAGFNVTEENLNYSKKGLLGVFGKYFDEKTATEYARKPQLIASRVYANRLGNSTENSGEGWKYRGRGYIQLTGKENYIKFGKFAGYDWVTNPDLVATKYRADSACLFWKINRIGTLAKSSDLNTIKLITKGINGKDNGLDDRIKKFTKYWNELQKNPTLWT